jgi:hypothetical protein
MNNLAFLLVGLALFGVGCAARVQTVTMTQLSTAIQSHSHERLNDVSYAGTQQGCHYIVQSLSTGSVMYRVPVSELDVENPFPVTSDKTEWRHLRWNLEPAADSEGSSVTNLRKP